MKRVTPNMKLGVNSDVNADGIVSVGIKHNLGVSKVKLPHASQLNMKIKDENHTKISEEKDLMDSYTPTTSKHELNLIVITIAAAGVAWYIFR